MMSGKNCTLTVGDKRFRFEALEIKETPAPEPREMRIIDLGSEAPQDDVPTFTALSPKTEAWLRTLKVGDEVVEIPGTLIPRNEAARRLCEHPLFDRVKYGEVTRISFGGAYAFGRLPYLEEP